VESCTALVEQPDGSIEVLRWQRPRAQVIALPGRRTVPVEEGEGERVVNG
jgi:hypothetical protein